MATRCAAVAKTGDPLSLPPQAIRRVAEARAPRPPATGTTAGGSGRNTSSPRYQRVCGSAAGAGLGLGTPGLSGSAVEPPVLRASSPGEPAACAGQQPRPAFRLSAVGSADGADHTTAVARCTSITPTNNTPRQHGSDPAAGDSLPPLRTNRHSASWESEQTGADNGSSALSLYLCEECRTPLQGRNKDRLLNAFLSKKAPPLAELFC